MLVLAGWAVGKLRSLPPASIFATSCFTQEVATGSQDACAVEAGVSANELVAAGSCLNQPE